jgi:hypothetical protein
LTTAACRASGTLDVVVRVDLPPLRRVRSVAECLGVPLVENHSAAVAMIAVGGRGRTPAGDLPHRELLARFESVFADLGFPVVHQLWTPDTADGQQWHCYDRAGCTRMLPDPAVTDLAAALAHIDRITYRHRRDIVATLQPELGERLARVAASRARLTGNAEPAQVDSGGLASQTDPNRAGWCAVQEAIKAAAASPPSLSEDDVIGLVGALAEHKVRDTFLDFDTLDVAAAERLWTTLAKTAPPPKRAEATCLLAFSAYVRGDGVLAGIALAQSEAADPEHQLSNLLRTTLALGMSPRRLRAAGIKAATLALQELGGVGRVHTQPALQLGVLCPQSGDLGS